MAIVTWAVKPNGLSTTTKDGNADFVVRVEYVITGTDGVNTIALPYTESFDAPTEDFTPFESLSEAQVIAWAQDKMGSAQLANLQAAVETSLSNMANPPPPVVEKAAPWSA